MLQFQPRQLCLANSSGNNDHGNDGHGDDGHGDDGQISVMNGEDTCLNTMNNILK